jgi:hypothetical protein
MRELNGQINCVLLGKPEEIKARPAAASASAPKLIQPLKDQLVNEGEPVHFQCQIQAVPGTLILRTVLIINII